jgi:hypothetical protein
MKSILKNLTALSIAVLSIIFISTNAHAERAHFARGSHRLHLGPPHGRGGFGIGFRGGYGGFGFGYRSYYRPFVYGALGYPVIGFSLGYLPYGYYPFYWGPDLYYYYDGIYYRQYNDSYQVVEPPVGAEVTTLPAKAKPIVIDGQQYYEMDGVYYKEVIHPDNTKGYHIAGKNGVLNTNPPPALPAGPRVGDVVSQLPQDSRQVSIAGKKYYVAPDDTYYEDFNDGKTSGYKIVGLANNQNQQQAQPQQQNNKQQSNPPQIIQQ